jgi:ParB family chromosome partitioning protein
MSDDRNADKSGARKVLGKGLGALIPAADPDRPAPEGRRWVEIKPIEDLEPGKYQPRRTFEDEPLRELAQSIKEKGIIQPIVVRKRARGYEIVIGERRWRAAQLAGLTEVPVILTDATGADALELALIENIQRQDLNPIEEAMAYDRLMTEFGLTQETVASRVGKDRSTVANIVRLLALPEKLRDLLVSGELSVGHARALLAVESDAEKARLAREIIAKKLTVRQVEEMIRRTRTSKAIPLRTQATQLKALSEELQRRYRTKVSIVDKGKRGSIVIEYYSFEELDRLVQALLGR